MTEATRTISDENVGLWQCGPPLIHRRYLPRPLRLNPKRSLVRSSMVLAAPTSARGWQGKLLHPFQQMVCRHVREAGPRAPVPCAASAGRRTSASRRSLHRMLHRRGVARHSRCRSCGADSEPSCSVLRERDGGDGDGRVARRSRQATATSQCGTIAALPKCDAAPPNGGQLLTTTDDPIRPSAFHPIFEGRMRR